MICKLKTIWLTSIVLLSSLVAQGQTGNDATDEPLNKNTFGITWNAVSLVKNYPTFLLAGHYTFQNQFAIEAGLGYVFNSEVYVVDKEHMEHHSGYNWHAEVKYFIVRQRSGGGAFVGISYSYLSSKFNTDYVLIVPSGDNSYYQNFDREYQTVIHQYIANAGYRYVSKDRKIFFEATIGLNHSDKQIDQDPIPNDATIVSNQDFFNHINDFPVPLTTEFNIGFFLSK